MNDAIKRKIKESRIMQYEIAAKIGISEYTFCRWFRKELTANSKSGFLPPLRILRRVKLMSDTLTIKTSGVAVLGEEQAKHFALSIFADVKAYIKEHRAEYEQWLTEQEAGEMDEDAV